MHDNINYQTSCLCYLPQPLISTDDSDLIIIIITIIIITTIIIIIINIITSESAQARIKVVTLYQFELLFLDSFYFFINFLMLFIIVISSL